jgi:lipid A disaccharide synthetase
MCSSDFAVLHNGEVTVEAGALHLPALIINNMGNIRAYISYLYNGGHESPLNIANNYEAYEELNGSLTAIG